MTCLQVIAWRDRAGFGPHFRQPSPDKVRRAPSPATKPDAQIRKGRPRSPAIVSQRRLRRIRCGFSGQKGRRARSEGAGWSRRRDIRQPQGGAHVLDRQRRNRNRARLNAIEGQDHGQTGRIAAAITLLERDFPDRSIRGQHHFARAIRGANHQPHARSIGIPHHPLRNSRPEDHRKKQKRRAKAADDGEKGQNHSCRPERASLSTNARAFTRRGLRPALLVKTAGGAQRRLLRRSGLSRKVPE